MTLGYAITASFMTSYAQTILKMKSAKKDLKTSSPKLKQTEKATDTTA
jgi:hypothetical protein